MWFHIPITVVKRDKSSRVITFKKVNMAIELKKPEFKGPCIILETATKTIKIDIKNTYGHANAYSIGVDNGESYFFTLSDGYSTVENRIMLRRFIEITKLISKGRSFKLVELKMFMTGLPQIKIFRETWLEIAKKFSIPRIEYYLSKIDLSGRQLKTIPSCLGNLHLREVILDNNNLGHSNEFWNWLKGPINKSLEDLSIKNNQLRLFPSAIVLCERLTTLTISYNNIKKLPCRLFSKPTSLKNINASFNAHLSYWPYPTEMLSLVICDGCNDLNAGLLPSKNVQQPDEPYSLVDLAASVILNNITHPMFEKLCDQCPSILLDKLNWARLCSGCHKFYTRPMGQLVFPLGILTTAYHGPHLTATRLKFNCGCRRF